MSLSSVGACGPPSGMITMAYAVSQYTYGRWDGVDIEMGNCIGRKIGFTRQYVPLTANERMLRLTQPNEIKLVISNFSIHDNFFFSSRRRHTRFDCDWSSDVCSSD